MRALDRKMVRDLGRLWAQALAAALVLASGVATLVLAVGAYRSLDDTRAAYYERYRFGHVFASATRAPNALLDRIAAIEGVAAVQGRVVEAVLLDVPGVAEPATGIAVSLPDRGEPAVNGLYLRSGRLPEPGRVDEVAVNEAFATANGLSPGGHFSAVMNGVERRLTVTGIVLSPEYIYALGPGTLVPDNRRFGVLFMSREALGSVFDMDGAFDDVSLRLRHRADQAAVIEALDALLAPYGGTGAYGRKDQVSNAFLDGELTQLLAMAKVIPPIFLLVSAYLINMILSRLIALEREQIGLLKALGYSGAQVSAHYLKLVLVIAFVGIAIGFGAGSWLGIGLTRLYGDFYSFPFLIFHWTADTYVLAAGVAVAATTAGALRAVRSAAALPPAVAMRPPSPPTFRRTTLESLGVLRLFSQLTVMALRHIVRWPLRTGLSALGTSFAVSLLVVALFTFDSVEFMVDALFFRAEREDATIAFATARPPSVTDAVGRLPGVMRTEPYRAVPVVIRHGHLERRLSITGKPPQTDLSRVLDDDLRPVRLPESGLAVSERVAAVLDLRRGDLVEVEILEGARRTALVPVTEIIQSYLGLMRLHGHRRAGAADRGGAARLRRARLDRSAEAARALRGGEADARRQRGRTAGRGARELPRHDRGEHDDQHDGLRRAGGDHRLRRRLQFRAHPALGAGARARRPAGPRLHPLGGLARAPRRADGRRRFSPSPSAGGSATASPMPSSTASRATSTACPSSSSAIPSRSRASSSSRRRRCPRSWCAGASTASTSSAFSRPGIDHGLDQARRPAPRSSPPSPPASYYALRPQPVGVDLATIARGPIDVTVGEEGMTRIRDVYRVSAPISGHVSRTPLRVGDRVDRGGNPHHLDPPRRSALHRRAHPAASSRRRCRRRRRRSATPMRSWRRHGPSFRWPRATSSGRSAWRRAARSRRARSRRRSPTSTPRRRSSARRRPTWSSAAAS